MAGCYTVDTTDKIEVPVGVQLQADAQFELQSVVVIKDGDETYVFNESKRAIAKGTNRADSVFFGLLIVTAIAFFTGMALGEESNKWSR